ncbi:MAG: hypothetical protein J2P58_10275 [Acidimicrobiaceae bacterium]|nr:hypothetical protein [Acidimicrobiaceae bacterium]
MTDLEQLDAQTIETVLVEGNLAKLGPEQRVAYYARVCETLGLNPLTRPFDYINFQGRLTLYANKDCAAQLRHRDGISMEIAGRDMLGDAGIYLVIARAITRDGRAEESIGAVSVAGLRGQNLADALMKAETKAKRRVTLAVCGLGWLDETEMDSVRVLDSDQSPAVEQARPGETPPPRTGPPIMSDRQRGKLRRRWVALDDAGQAQVRNRARAEGLPWPLGEAHARDYDAYDRLIGDAERAGWVAADLNEAWERGHQTQTERSRAVPSAQALPRDREEGDAAGSVGEVGPGGNPPDDQ